jgi:hypothetical protein
VTAQDDGDEGTQDGAEVAYECAPAGIPRRGRRVCYGRTAGLARRGIAAAIAARYPVGAAVSVAYDPAEPDRSVLEPGVHLGDCLARAAFGLALIGFGAGFGHWT